MNRSYYTPKKSAREWNKAREEMQKKYDCWNCFYIDYCNPLTGCKKEKRKSGVDKQANVAKRGRKSVSFEDFFEKVTKEFPNGRPRNGKIGCISFNKIKQEWTYCIRVNGRRYYKTHEQKERLVGLQEQLTKRFLELQQSNQRR